MAVPVTIPRLGWTMEEGTFIDWLKQDGDQVREGDELFTLESDKATEAVQALAAGILRIVPGGPRPGQTVRVGQVIAYLLQPGEVPPFVPGPGIPPATLSTPPAAAVSGGVPEPPPATHGTPESSQRPLPATSLPPNALGSSPRPDPHTSSSSATLPQFPNALGTSPRPDAVPASSATASPAQHELSAGGQPKAPGPAPRRVASSPRARRVARELGVDWRTIKGTGPAGRVVERDVRRAAAAAAGEAASATPSERAVQPPPMALSPTRRSIAAHMLASVRATAPVTLTATVDATQLKLVRDQLRAGYAAGQRVPDYTELLVKLTALVLHRHPALCCRWLNEDLQPCMEIDINVAIDTQAGLVAPVVREADRLSLAELSERLHVLVEQARAGRLRAADMAVGCFTVSNLGMYAVDVFTPIVNYPQVAILGVGRIAPRPAVYEGSLCVRQLMTLSLTFDHRAVDGAPAARFLTDICRAVEQPLAWLLDPARSTLGREKNT